MTGSVKYPGDVWGCADVLFEIEDWVRTQEDLVAFEKVFYLAAHEHKWTREGNIRGNWPARAVRRQRWARWEKYGVSLEPDFLSDRRRIYTFGHSVGGGRSTRGKEQFTQIMVLTSEQMRDVKTVLELVELHVGPIRGLV
jgi:hypothetical protein